MSKNLDEAVRLQSEERQEWIRERRGDRQGITEDASSAPHLTDSSASLFPPGKRVSLDPLQPDRTGESRQLLQDLPESFRQEERWRRG